MDALEVIILVLAAALRILDFLVPFLALWMAWVLHQRQKDLVARLERLEREIQASR